MKIGDYDYPEPGCYIDCGHLSARTLDERICRLAVAYGWENLGSPMCDNCDEWTEAADEAVDFLNELEDRPDFYWEIQDNSLFLTRNTEEECA
jgi:hypothetical protein